jgi:hypothetical protein
VPQAHAQDRHLARQLADDLDRDPGLLGEQGPGETRYGLGLKARASATVNLIIPFDREVRAQFPRYCTKL